MRCPACEHDNFEGTDYCDGCGLDMAGLDVRAWGIDPEDPKLAQRVSRLPLKESLVVAPEDSVADAITAMVEAREGCVFVCDQGELVGVLTERDIATRILARDRDPEETRVDQAMTRNPFTVRKDDRLAFALHRMGVDGFRHLPVMGSDQKLAGFLSMRAVLSELSGPS